MRKSNWKKALSGFGGWVLKALVVYALVVVFMCQIEFEITVIKKKTGIIQTVTNIADNIYSGYKNLTGGAI